MTKVFTKSFTLKAILLAFCAFVTTYLVISSAVWFSNSFSPGGGFGIKHRLSSFVTKYQESLKSNVFDTLFAQAQQCVGLPDGTIKEHCQKDIGWQLGTLLKEEELADAKGNSWPNDLFFVRQENETFYQLGWDGQLKDISSLVEKKQIQARQSYVSLLLRKNCNFFRISSASDACEVYETIALGADENGYIIRLLPFEEENDFRIVAVMPFLVFLSLSDVNFTEFGPEQFSFITLSVINIIIPLLASLWVFVHYRKRS